MMIGVSMLLTSVVDSVNAESISIFTLQQEIDRTEDILVTGFANVESSYIPVKLEMYDPNDNLVFKPDVKVNDDGQFSWLFHPPLGMFDTIGTYTIIASHEELKETAIIQFKVVEKIDTNNAWLESINTEASVDNTQSSTFSGTVTQNDVKTSSAEIPSQTGSSELVQKPESSKDVITQKSLIEEITEPTNTSNQQETLNAESPVIMTAIALSIAGIVSGVVIWTRITYQKPIIKK